MALPSLTDAALMGAHVRLFPYARGFYGRDTLHTLWQMVEAEGTGDLVFYAQACPTDTWRGDLVEFVQYFSQTQPRRDLVAVATREPVAPIGLVWVDEVPGQPYGLIGLWYKRKHTRLAREGTALALQYMRETLGYTDLRGFTPWRSAVLHMRAQGWRTVATLPAFVTIKGHARDITVMRQGA